MTYFTLEGGHDGLDNVAIVTSPFDAFDAGDLDTAVGTVADDFELVDVAAGQTLHRPLPGPRELRRASHEHSDGLERQGRPSAQADLTGPA